MSLTSGVWLASVNSQRFEGKMILDDFSGSKLRESMLHMSGGRVPELVSRKAESSVSNGTEVGKGHSTLRGSEGVGWGDNMVI